MNEDEAQLLERVQQGDAAAFDKVVRIYLARAYAVAFRVLRNREDAEDLTQEAFIAALTNIAAFDIRRPFGPWLFRIVVNRALNALKARALRRTDPIPQDYEAEGVSPEAALEQNEAGRRLTEALSGLPERRELIVRLFELEGFSSDEIGEMLDLPAGTVRWHLHEARAALRAALAPLKEGKP
jgi:RNA polymerase sigma-70 factor (ECF subfamily)